MINKILLYMRKTLNKTQKEITSILDIGISTYASYENLQNMPNFEFVKKVANLASFDVMFINRTDKRQISSDNIVKVFERDLETKLKNYDDSINKYLIYLRRTNKLLQKEVAYKLGITTSAYGSYEKMQNSPNYDIVEKVADICDYDIIFVNRDTNEIVSKDNIIEELYNKFHI